MVGLPQSAPDPPMETGPALEGKAGLSSVQRSEPRMSPTACRVSAVLAAVVLSLPVRAEEPSATPYRPTVSNPADLSAPGYVEVEAGGLYTEGGGVTRRASMPWLAKYAFSDRFGILLGGEAMISQTDDLGSDSGFGDTSATLKMKRPVTDSSAFGLEAGMKAPTAHGDLGSGHTDYTVTGIYSQKLATISLDLNVGVTHLGLVDRGEGRSQYNWAAAASHDLNGDFGVAAEFSGTSRQGVSNTSQFLMALTYSVSPQLVLDAGAAWGLNPASLDWSAFAGMTLLLDKAFR